MSQSPEPAPGGWLRTTGLLDIARTLGFAVHPPKLGLALAAIIVTLLYGGLLDLIWKQGRGVDRTAIQQFLLAREMGEPYAEPPGDRGIFQVWREHQRRCVLGLLGSPILSVSQRAPAGMFADMQAARDYLPWYRNLADMGRGTWWMIRHHPLYFLLFGVGTLIVWALAGGAICRMAAVQFARDEKITTRQAVAFALRRLFSGFVLAPCIPVAFIILATVVLVLGGVFLRIPVVGDVFGSLLFVFALMTGLMIAVLLVSLLVGGSLFWPAVAAEGSDAFDAFSRGLAYPFSRPWKTILYFAIAVIYAAICWLVVSLFVYWALLITRSIVSWGTAPFGRWQRTEDGLTKLELLWPLGGASGLHQWPDWSRLGVFEDFAAAVIGVYVVVAIGLMWAFLFSFCFSADSIIYFLLRRDVDGNDTSEVFLEEPQTPSVVPTPAAPQTAATS